MYHLDIPKTRQYDHGKVEVIARSSAGEARTETTLTVKQRSGDYRGVLKSSPRRKFHFKRKKKVISKTIPITDLCCSEIRYISNIAISKIPCKQLYYSNNRKIGIVFIMMKYYSLIISKKNEFFKVEKINTNDPTYDILAPCTFEYRTRVIMLHTSSNPNFPVPCSYPWSLTASVR